MSITTEGTTKCDRCGNNLVNGSLAECVLAVDTGEDGMTVNYHFCRESGCASKVLTKRNLEHRIGRDQHTGLSTPGK